jgi:hypothetical protein
LSHSGRKTIFHQSTFHLFPQKHKERFDEEEIPLLRFSDGSATWILQPPWKSQGRVRSLHKNNQWSGGCPHWLREIRMSVETTLLNAKNPVLHFHKYFMQHIIQPIRELQKRMQQENAARELFIVKQLVLKRQAAQHARAIRYGLVCAA